MKSVFVENYRELDAWTCLRWMSGPHTFRRSGSCTRSHSCVRTFVESVWRFPKGFECRGAKRISTDVRLKTLGIISHHPTDLHVHASRIFLQPRVPKADPTVAYPGLQTGSRPTCTVRYQAGSYPTRPSPLLLTKFDSSTQCNPQTLAANCRTQPGRHAR